MNSKILFIVFITLNNSITSGYSQVQTGFRIRGTNVRYSTGDWISYSTTRWINSLAQGIDNIYFGTTGGIARYNFFTNRWDYPYTTSNGLPDNNILVVAYDNDTNYLWCATPLGISCFRSAFQQWDNYFSDEVGLPIRDNIISIGFDNDNVWFESMTNRLFRTNKQGGLFEEVTQSSRQFSNYIQWFGFRSRSSNQLPLLFLGGRYWFNSEGFIEDSQFNRYDVSCWILDKWGSYWIGTAGLGAGKADARIKQLDLLPYGLFMMNVLAVELDKLDYSLWIGGFAEYHNESGITHWHIKSDTWSYLQAKYITELVSDQVTSIAIDQPFVWFGTDYGVARYDKYKNSWQRFDVFSHLADNYVFDVEVDEENVWIATTSGLTKIIKKSINSDSLQVEQIAPENLRQVKVFDIELMNNLIWLGTERGVFVYDQAKNIGGYQAEPGGPMDEAVYTVSCLKNEVWFGLKNGIEMFDVDQKKWLGVPYRRFGIPETVLSVKADEKAVWAGTTQGVLKFNRETNFWSTFTIEDGLLDNVINTIVIDGDYLWVGTPKGLTRFYWNNPHRID